jgi:hypothetical protein
VQVTFTALGIVASITGLAGRRRCAS